MAQGDVLIFINVIVWVFFLFFVFFFVFFGNLLPSVFKNIRVQSFFDIFLKQQFYFYFLNFYQKIVVFFKFNPGKKAFNWFSSALYYNNVLSVFFSRVHSLKSCYNKIFCFLF